MAASLKLIVVGARCLSSREILYRRTTLRFSAKRRLRIIPFDKFINGVGIRALAAL
jgi:hypothetical protein